MSIEVRACGSREELRDALNVIGHYFGTENDLEDTERFAQWIDVERVHAAWEGDEIVGGTGALGFRISGLAAPTLPQPGSRSWAFFRPTAVAAC